MGGPRDGEGPRDGDVYEAARDVAVDFLVHWQAPMTSGGSGVLPRGARCRVRSPSPGARAVSADLLDADLERRLVPEDERTHPKYDGMTLSLPVSRLGRDWVKVPPPAAPQVERSYASGQLRGAMDETRPGPAMAAAAALEAPETEALPVTSAEYRATAVLLLFFVANILLAVVFAQPFLDAGLQAFKDPDKASNVGVYLVMILGFTFLILWLAKRYKWMIRVIILAAVGATVAYVVYPVLDSTLGWELGPAVGAGIAVAAACVAALYWHPEWYVIDAVGLLVAAGSAAVFGISLGIVPTVLLLAALAVYDAIAVYRTKHMLSLADTVIELRLPVLLVIPKVAHYRFRAEANKFKEARPENKGEREAMFMGLGDLVMPTILVVSALQFGAADWGVLPSLGAAIGTLAGFGVLMGYVLKGRPQAGLPLLNGGALVGFLAGVYWASGSLVFW